MTPIIEAIRPKARATKGKQADTEDHSANILRRGGFKEIGSTTGTVTYVISHQVGYNRGIARIILWDSRFDLTDKVRANIGRLGINSSAQLGKQGDERSAKAVTDYSKWNFLRIVS